MRADENDEFAKLLAKRKPETKLKDTQETEPQ
jgi:hypothetical protein